jgi:hypothetical protein
LCEYEARGIFVELPKGTTGGVGGFKQKRGVTVTRELISLLEKGLWVSADNPLLVSVRLADTIYRI